MVVRFDRAPISKSEKLPDGRLRVWATFSRVGPLRYVDSEGQQRVEYVTAEELFKTDSLETAGLAPVTLGHPKDGMVTPDNWQKYSVGASGSTIKANPENGVVDVVFVVGAREALDRVDAGEITEVSAGYTAVVEQRADGKFYQTDRKYNHLALVERGRAGPDVKLHLDAADDWAIQTFDDCSTPRKDMKTYKGMEMSEDAVKAFQDMEDKLEKITADMAGMKEKKDSAESELLTTVTAERDMLQGRVDSLTKERDSRMDAATVESKAQALAQEKFDAFQAASPYLAEPKFDAAVTPLDWKKQAIAAANPSLKLDGKDESYVNAAFDMLEQFGAQQRTDKQRADEFKQTLETAQVGGRKSGQASLTRQDATDDEEAQFRADRESATAAYCWKEGN